MSFIFPISLMGPGYPNPDPEPLCWGDSLTAGTVYTRPDQYYPALLTTLFSPLRPVLNGGVGGQTAAQIAARQTVYPVGTCINIIWAGVNDLDSIVIDPGLIPTVVASVQSMIDHVSNGRYAVLSTVNATSIGPGAPKYEAMLALNAAYLAAWPDNYINVQPALNDSNTRGADTLHLNLTGNTIVATAAHDYIIGKGW